MKLFILNICFSICLLSVAQSEERLVSNRLKAQTIIDNQLKAETVDKDYLLLSIADELYLVIVKNKNYYIEYFIRNDSVLYNKKYKIKDKILKKAFDPELYINKGTAHYDVSKIELGNGNNTYFYLMTKDKKKHGETSSVTMISPTPIDSDVYYYLLNKLVILNSEN